MEEDPGKLLSHMYSQGKISEDQYRTLAGWIHKPSPKQINIEVLEILEYLYQNGLLKYREKAFVDALEIFSFILQINLGADKVWNAKGAVLLQLKSYREALGAFTQALAANPANQQAVNNQKIAIKKVQAEKLNRT